MNRLGKGRVSVSFWFCTRGSREKKRKENETKKINFLSPSSRGVEIHFSFSLSLHSLNLIAPTELTNHAVANISEIVNRNEPAMTT